MIATMNDKDLLENFDYASANYEKWSRQWDADVLMKAFVAKLPEGWENGATTYIGITDRDIYARNYNFLFGWGGKTRALLSTRRFTGEFNDTPPKRSRLLKRTMMQLLSSAGHVFGVPRCTTPTCARAYPNSLDEHDAKTGKLCRDCRSGFDQALGR